MSKKTTATKGGGEVLGSNPAKKGSRGDAETRSRKSEKTFLLPKLRFPEFRNDGEWVEVPMLRHLTESRIRGSSGNIARKITVKLWGKGVYEKDETTAGSLNTQYYQRKAGQFIYSKLDFLNQAFGIIPESLDRFESTVDLPCFDIGNDLSPNFLLEYVQRKSFYKRYGEIADGGRKAKRIQVETFLGFPISLPPRTAEQQKIADCLGSLDDLIAAHQRKLSALQDHKKGLLQQLFPAEGQTTPKLRFPGFEGEWKVKNLNEACQMKAGKFVKAAEIKAESDQNSYPCYGGNGLRGYTSTYTHEGRYPLIGRQGALCGNVQIATGQFHATEHAVVATPRNSTKTDWIFYALIFLNLNRFATGQAQPGLSVEILERVPLPIPKPPEQQKIADCLSALDACITAQTEQIAALKEHKKGLMQKLFPS
ncbi:MAG: restriction endonuclease subunit S [Opitutales bacterium]|nr:restriction endonuclease subunit S [Opitutales bacterium]